MFRSLKQCLYLGKICQQKCKQKKKENVPFLPRFTTIQKMAAERPPPQQTVTATIREDIRQQRAASAKNRRLAQMMANRPTVQAALQPSNVSIIHSFIHSVRPSFLFIYPSVHSFTHSFVRRSCLSVRSSIHPPRHCVVASPLVTGPSTHQSSRGPPIPSLVHNAHAATTQRKRPHAQTRFQMNVGIKQRVGKPNIKARLTLRGGRGAGGVVAARGRLRGGFVTRGGGVGTRGGGGLRGRGTWRGAQSGGAVRGASPRGACVGVGVLVCF